MRYKLTTKRRLAGIMLMIMLINILTPCVSFALTSGPVQPETKGFQPAGASDMVDVGTGDLKYNVPLLDIDGYPINLTYQANAGIDDEANWVGLGWSLTPGAINRQIRGIPDDFAGDQNSTYTWTKPKVTVGGRLSVKGEVIGRALSGSVNVGIFSDNYTGIGAEIGVNAGISYGIGSGSFLTAGMGVGVLSNTQTGVDVTPYVSLSVKQKADANSTINAGFSAQLGYNTRSGMKDLTLGHSLSGIDGDSMIGYNATNVLNESGLFSTSSSISYNTPPISPTIQVPFSTKYSSFSLDIGYSGFTVFVGGGGAGYQNKRWIPQPLVPKPAYGFLYAERGKNNPDAVMDFIREKDNPVIPEIPNIAIPIHTPDVWSYTSQTGGGQFRLYRGGSGIFFDNTTSDNSSINTLGGDYGFGFYAHGGLTEFDQHGTNITRKWTEGNEYLKNGDFQDQVTNNANAQHVYFKTVGEKGVADSELAGKVSNTDPVAILTDISHAYSKFKVNNASQVNALPNIKTSRRPNRTVISYLTAREAAGTALEKMIKMYPVNDSATFSLPANNRPLATDSVSRIATGSYRQPHHISEMTITDDGGKRMVYGIPVYNTKQDEYTFAVGRNYTLLNRNQVATPAGVIADPKGDNHLGLDDYYQQDSKKPYATSFLLTAILSPDYVDKTNNGISDDDLGTAIKFNYSKLAPPFKWRTPYQNATLNKCLLADPDDDKGSIIYGEKELWYISSIESKTKVAYFITQDRRDALGAAGWQYGGTDATVKQKLLKEIRLYSKSDMSRPIKVVKFQYDYELCRNIPNSLDVGTTDPLKGGKLTLKRVWFEYGNSNKGKYHPYIFDYNRTTANSRAIGNIDSLVKYDYLSTDRWGVYKNNDENKPGLNNDTYPYSNQNKAQIDDNSALWHLKKISLPTGGNIVINYESNDYAYVQDKKATTMSGIESLIKSPNMPPVDTNDLKKAHGVRLKVDTTAPTGANQTKWFKDNFLNGSDYLYTKMYIKLSTNASPAYGRDYDYVPVYCKISSVTFASGGMADVIFTDISESGVTVNPISLAAWQRQKNEYPRYAYPGFDNRVASENSSVLGAVMAIVQAAANLGEITQNYYEKANSHPGYASDVDLSRSFVKLVNIRGFKYGGGTRVKKIAIQDRWQQMLNDNTQVAGAYGQAYNYTTTVNNKTISSGVATYEPAVGNDENALKEPVMYGQNIRGGINNYYSLEKPFCESLYPAPSIGYSKVTVNDLDANGLPSKKTGSVVNEFYTAKDFPVKVTVLPILEPREYRPSNYFSLVKTTSEDDLTLSQGYAIELNDMHGKPKAVRVLDKGDAEISSTVYCYKHKDGDDGQLDNHADIIDEKGVLRSNVVLGQDMEFFTDFRQQETKNTGNTYNFGFDSFPIFIFAAFLPHWPSGANDELRTFRSACALKVVQTYGMVDHIVKTQNGSSITTQNIAYDGLTGDPIITKTQNEFNKDIYSVNLPAYWVYDGMGGAYKNLGVYLSAFTTNANGEIKSAYGSYLHAGDEVCDINKGSHYWVIDNAAVSGSGNTKKLIDSTGVLKKSFGPYQNGLIKIVRSGYRNMLGASASSIVCLNNPLVTSGGITKLAIADIANTDLTNLKVINASATTFDENWAVENGAKNKILVAGVATENTDYPFDIRQGSQPSDGYGNDGASIKKTDTSTAVTDTAIFWKSNLKSRAGIWVGAPDNVYGLAVYNGAAGFDTCITIPTTKTYYAGYAADNYMQVTIDGVPFVTTDVYASWKIKPIMLTAGTHTLHVYFMNGSIDPAHPPTDLTIGGPASAGFEIYNNTYYDLIDPAINSSDLNFVFTTSGLRSASKVRSFVWDDDDSMFHYRYNYNSACGPLYGFKAMVINPYILGYVGNWRPYQTKVFQQSRNYVDIFNTNQRSVNIQNAGYINKFTPHWYWTGTAWAPNTGTLADGWTTANTVTLYDKYGQQLENKDALNRYSAADFDFNGELPSAVASNAMSREIYSNTLEDAHFIPGRTVADTVDVREFIQPSTKKKIKELYSNTYAHTGNYSVKLPYEGFTLTTIVHSKEQKTDPYLDLDASKQYTNKLDQGLYPNGFEPLPNHKYVFTVWVRDGNRYDKYINTVLKVNNVSIPLTCKTILEGWKLMEGTFTTGGSGTQTVTIMPLNGWEQYVDDIRIHPFNAHMKTYAYDDKTMRLMAELDENAYATFYEYDDEGLLVRVKKETERGIMTIKESRSSYIRNNK